MAGEGEALQTAGWWVMGERFQWSSLEYERPAIGIGPVSAQSLYETHILPLETKKSRRPILAIWMSLNPKFYVAQFF
ncbi:unnamed protein product [Ilex paraguariensis]|uniref:Uncharacterized protein n=1 Tax=Ilex paraguariensis TaxID=185542 RepID=A0ABC8RII6_9AQUA